MRILPNPPPEDDDLPPAAPHKYRTPEEAARIYFLPNLFTAGNLFFGFVAIIRCIQARYGDWGNSNELYTEAVWCILFAAFCDALDGRLARLGGRESLFGKEFDSIADTVSFGVAPALMVFFLILGPGLVEYADLFQQIGWLVGFVYLLCVAVRLARFNVVTNPLLPGVSAKASTKDFMGLPSPAAAGFVASLVLAMLHMNFAMPVMAEPSPTVGIAQSQGPTEYFMRGDDGKEYGPVSAQELRQWVSEDRANGQTEVRVVKGGPFLALNLVPELNAPVANALAQQSAKETIQQFAILLLPLLLLVALLMVSNIPYPSFKHIDWQTQTRARPFILFIIAIAIAYRLRFFSPAIFFLGYIFYGLFRDWRRTWIRKHRLATEPPLPPEPDDPEEDEAF